MPQLPLGFSPSNAFERRDFVVSAPNLDAWTRLEAWPGAGGGALALIGAQGTGKSHLARLWTDRVGARPVNADATIETLVATSPVLVVEDVDRGFVDASLFHLINLGLRPGAGLLLTARTPPTAWTTALPDLRSRLNALPVVSLGEPDDAILEGMLQKAFRAHRIRPAQDLLSYLVRRVERTSQAAEAAVARLDDQASARNRPVGRALAVMLFGALED